MLCSVCRRSPHQRDRRHAELGGVVLLPAPGAGVIRACEAGSVSCRRDPGPVPPRTTSMNVAASRSSPSATSASRSRRADGRRSSSTGCPSTSPRRDALHRRRIRLGQVDDRARHHAAPAASRWRGSPAAAISLAGRDLAALQRARDARGARRRHRDDLPGADDLAQPGADHRPPAHRGDPRPPQGRARRGARAGAEGARRGAGSASRSGGSGNTRTNSPAACASG